MLDENQGVWGSDIDLKRSCISFIVEWLAPIRESSCLHGFTGDSSGAGSLGETRFQVIVFADVQWLRCTIDIYIYIQ